MGKGWTGFRRTGSRTRSKAPEVVPSPPHSQQRMMGVHVHARRECEMGTIGMPSTAAEHEGFVDTVSSRQRAYDVDVTFGHQSQEQREREGGVLDRVRAVFGRRAMPLGDRSMSLSSSSSMIKPISIGAGDSHKSTKSASVSSKLDLRRVSSSYILSEPNVLVPMEEIRPAHHHREDRTAQSVLLPLPPSSTVPATHTSSGHSRSLGAAGTLTSIGTQPHIPKQQTFYQPSSTSISSAPRSTKSFSRPNTAPEQSTTATIIDTSERGDTLREVYGYRYLHATPDLPRAVEDPFYAYYRRAANASLAPDPSPGDNNDVEMAVPRASGGIDGKRSVRVSKDLPITPRTPSNGV